MLTFENLNNKRVMETNNHSKSAKKTEKKLIGVSLKVNKITPIMLCFVMIFATTACVNKNKKEKEILKTILEASGINIEEAIKVEDRKTKKENQPFIVKSEEGKENIHLIFEDERKTFEVYACWTVKTFIDKGQYGDENNKKYYIDERRTKVVNKNSKKLHITLRDRRDSSNSEWAIVEPYGEDYTKRDCGLWYKRMNNNTGEMEFELPAIDFRFIE